MEHVEQQEMINNIDEFMEAIADNEMSFLLCDVWVLSSYYDSADKHFVFDESKLVFPFNSDDIDEQIDRATEQKLTREQMIKYATDVYDFDLDIVERIMEDMDNDNEFDHSRARNLEEEDNALIEKFQWIKSATWIERNDEVAVEALCDGSFGSYWAEMIDCEGEREYIRSDSTVGIALGLPKGHYGIGDKEASRIVFNNNENGGVVYETL